MLIMIRIMVVILENVIAMLVIVIKVITMLVIKIGLTHVKERDLSVIRAKLWKRHSNSKVNTLTRYITLRIIIVVILKWLSFIEF